MAEERKFIARMQILGGDQVKRDSEGAARSVEASAQRMQTAWQRVGSQAEGLEGGFKKLNRGVNDARGAIELLGGAIPGLDGAFGTMTRTIGNVADVFGTLSSLFLKNPIGLLAVGVAAAAAAFITFRGSAKDAAETQADLQRALEKTNELLLAQSQRAAIALESARKAALGQAEPILPNLEKQLAAAQTVFADREKRLRELQSLPASSTIGRAARSPEAEGKLREFEVQRDAAAAQVAQLRVQIDTLKEPAKFAQRELLFPGRGSLQFRVGGSREDLSEEEARARLREEAEARNRITGEAKARSEQGRAAAAAAAASAAAEEQRAIDQLIGRYAPAIKAEQELSSARADAIRLMREGKITGSEFEGVLRGIAEAEQKGTAAAQERAALQQFAARTIEEVKTAEQRYAEAIAATDEALRAGLVTADQAARKRELEVKRLEEANSGVKEEARRNKEIARDLGLTFQSAFEDAVISGARFRDVLRGIVQDIARLILRRTVTEPAGNFLTGIIGGGIGSLFGGGFANASSAQLWSMQAQQGMFARGGVFSGGAQVVPFANGGAIVDRPTTFPMRGGRLGLMGEAGEEAIMPLKRGPDGRLGVVAEGGGGGVVVNVAPVINLNGNGAGRDEQDQRLIGQAVARQVREAVQNEIRHAMRPGGQLYGAT
jgi:hypothetical protein